MTHWREREPHGLRPIWTAGSQQSLVQMGRARDAAESGLPTIYRGPYEYSHPESEEDFLLQDQPPASTGALR